MGRHEPQIVSFEEMTPAEWAQYFDHNYGTCAVCPCPCLERIFKQIHPWLGTGCPNWQPLGVRSWDELRERICASR